MATAVDIGGLSRRADFAKLPVHLEETPLVPDLAAPHHVAGRGGSTHHEYRRDSSGRCDPREFPLVACRDSSRSVMTTAPTGEMSECQSRRSMKGRPSARAGEDSDDSTLIGKVGFSCITVERRIAVNARSQIRYWQPLSSAIGRRVFCNDSRRPDRIQPRRSPYLLG